MQQTELQKFVEEIRSKLAASGPFNVDEFRFSSDIWVQTKLKLNDASQQLLAILGKEKVAEFYRDCEPKEANEELRLAGLMAWVVPACCEGFTDGRITLNTARLLENLERIADCIDTSVVSYSFSLHIVNIDIEKEFELGDGIYFRKLPPELVEAKYPLEQRFTPIPSMMEKSWSKHRVEAVISGCEKQAEIQRRSKIEYTEALINSILHAFLLAERPAKGQPCVTHIVLESPVEQSCGHHGRSGVYSFNPIMLTSEDVVKIQKAYAFLRAAGNDRVLQTATDRFILGKKRDLHHPNRINEPNWDKIVDYVIAMETLFLTVAEGSGYQELSYRFRLNGASLVSQAAKMDVLQAFHALKCLYDLRSKAVHGGEDSTILKPANEFIKRLQIDSPNDQHSLGRLVLVSRSVEEWIQKLLFFLGDIHFLERPYRKKDGWEYMLWRDAGKSNGCDPLEKEEDIR